ncbi:MAG: synthetase [Planctomycetota bacterium]
MTQAYFNSLAQNPLPASAPPEALDSFDLRTSVMAKPSLVESHERTALMRRGVVASKSAPAAENDSVLKIDAASECERIERAIRDAVRTKLRRRGVVLGVSGGIDSSVSVVLAARALGRDRVTAILMPERESSPASLELGRAACQVAGVTPEVVDITPMLEAFGCYRRRDVAIARVLPAFRPGDRFKITIANDVAESDRVNHFHVVASLSARAGATAVARLPVDVYLEVVAATNLKQRVRKTVEYTAADALNRAVLGTPNVLEHELGFFVRGGDGLADLKPIAHLYKSQVFALGRHLGLPASITGQIPTTDTYSLPQSQQEFYFGLPYATLDIILWCSMHQVSTTRAGELASMTPEAVERVYRDIELKRRAASRLDGPALMCSSVDSPEFSPVLSPTLSQVVEEEATVRRSAKEINP